MFDAATREAAIGEAVALELAWRDPLEVFSQFADDALICFLLSRGEAGPRSRFSYLCVDPVEIIRDAPPAALAAALGRYRRIWPDAPVPFSGGAAGFFSYESGAVLDGIAMPGADFAGLPGMQFGIYDIMLAWDHGEQRFWALSALGDQGARFDAVLRRLGAGAGLGPVAPLCWRASVSRETHMARVARTLAYIDAGDIYQANITVPFVAARPPGLRAADVFGALCDANPAPFSTFIACGHGAAIASVSPERFLRIDRTGRMETRPIKGTRPRGATRELDLVQAADLQASAKDRAENLMIVDLLRNDLSRVAEIGSVTVPALCELESFARVHHLVSVVEGQLRRGLSAADALRATLPGGSITGAPKIRAMQIIAEIESAKRGPYCGTAAWLGFDGAMDSNILIRTVTMTPDQVVAQAGGGIVADSDPAAEWDEAMTKISPLLQALGTLDR